MRQQSADHSRHGGWRRFSSNSVRWQTNLAPRNRLSFPFFDRNLFARLQPIDLPGQSGPADDQAERWDGASVHAFQGTYGEYLLNKVEKVFPELRQTALGI
jgi:hypothetical protein